MANKKFTLEEMEYLRGNEYVLDVTDSCVYFSAAYKAEFYQKLLAGKKAKDIFAESGINTDILGVNRVNGFRSLVLREAKSGKGFRDISTYTEFSGNYATSPDVRIKYLEQELAYKNQEIEFLKKIASLGEKESER